MIENLFWLIAGLVLGALYHAKVQPIALAAWEAVKKWGRRVITRPVD